MEVEQREKLEVARQKLLEAAALIRMVVEYERKNEDTLQQRVQREYLEQDVLGDVERAESGLRQF